MTSCVVISDDGYVVEWHSKLVSKSLVFWLHDFLKKNILQNCVGNGIWALNKKIIQCFGSPISSPGLYKYH